MSKVTFAGAPLWSERFRTCLDRQLLRPGAKIILYALLKTRLRLTENMARSRMHEDKSASSKSSNVTNRLSFHDALPNRRWAALGARYAGHEVGHRVDAACCRRAAVLAWR